MGIGADNGNSMYIDSTTLHQQIPSAQSVTMMGWYRFFTNDVREDSAFFIGCSPDGYLSFNHPYATNDLTFIERSASGFHESIVAEDFVNTDRWYHCAVVSEGGSTGTGVHFATGYLDGNLVGRLGSSGTGAGMIPNQVRVAGATWRLNGAFAHFRLWRLPLRPHQIRQEMRSARAVNRQGLLSEVPGNVPIAFSTTEVYDTLGNGWALTSSNQEPDHTSPVRSFPLLATSWFSSPAAMTALSWLAQGRIVGEPTPIMAQD